MYRLAKRGNILGLPLEPPHSVANMSAQEFLSDHSGLDRYYYGKLPKKLQEDVQVLCEAQHAYLWLSSSQVSPSWHWDSDHNLYSQVLGRKRFRFVSPTDSLAMRPYPRIHPSWHKGHEPIDDDVTVYVAELHPGDLLYSPPYWWHCLLYTSPSPRDPE